MTLTDVGIWTYFKLEQSEKAATSTPQKKHSNEIWNFKKIFSKTNSPMDDTVDGIVTIVAFAHFPTQLWQS
jgi:hypothetical protein